MKLAQVPWRRGANWVGAGFRVFLRRPLAFAGLFILYAMSARLLMLLWPVGPVLVLASMPIASLGFMIASRRVLDGQLPLPGVFLEPLRGERARRLGQLQLSGLYVIAGVLRVWIVTAIGGDALLALGEALASEPPSAEAVRRAFDEPRVHSALFAGVVLATAISLPFWHAPALVHWGGQGAVRSLFFSALACWRNKGAFTVFGLTWAAIVAGLQAISTLLGIAFGTPAAAVIASAPLALAIGIAFYTSVYFSFVDCFVGDEAETLPRMENES